jgi:arabinose-5-phosphate isomerase
MKDRPEVGGFGRAGEREFARRVLSDEAAAITALADTVGDSFHQAVDLLERCADQGGTVLVTGLGKSGLIGAKIAATLTSLGIASHYVHPTEAAHGDLGRFRRDDLCLALSNSGETDEVVGLAAALRQDNIPVISITGGPAGDEAALSSLERLATVRLRLGVELEAGAPEFAAPTSSTTATLALGDALALAAARRRNFTDEDFAKRHPGGALGGLLRPVVEVLRFSAGKNLPLITDTTPVREALQRAAEVGRRPGAIMLVDHDTGRLTGIFTDGDLRRLVLRDARELDRPIRDVMTRSPRSLPDTALVRDAVNMVREFRQDELPIVDAQGRPVGLLDVQDLVAMRLVKD